MRKKHFVELMGYRIAVNYDKPDSATSRLAILLPGYLDSKEYDHMIELSSDLVKHGYAAVSFDALGIWESEGGIELYSMTNYLRALGAIITWAVAQNDCQFETIVLVGHSMGAMVALRYAASHPNIDAVVGIMPGEQFIIPDDWTPEQPRYSKRDVPHDGTREYRVPYMMAADSMKYRTSESIEQTTKPILLIAGDHDEMHSPDSIEELAAKARSGLASVVVIAGADHDYRFKPGHIQKVNERIISFLGHNKLIS